MFEPMLIGLWIALMVGLSIPTLILLWHWRRHKQWPLIVAASLVAVATYGAIEMCLSFPKPIQWEISPPKRVEVLSYRVASGEYLYLWVLGPSGTPRYYVIPWSPRAEKLAGELKGKGAIAKRLGGKVYYEPGIKKKGDKVTVDMPQPAPLKQVK